jgi:CobQ-like glutamine amidotransferase family enzyme
MRLDKLSITIGWLYPDLMSTYGDRGNIICLKKRCQWRGIEVRIIDLGLENQAADLLSCDLLQMGGAQDRQQKIVSEDLRKDKGPIIKKMVEEGIPALFVCAAYQFMGHYYRPAEGKDIEGLHIFDLYTQHFGKDKPRCIGNVIIKNSNREVEQSGGYLVGFENHGGRTYLGKKVKPLGEVVVGFGNNGEDKTEGCLYKNAIGTYLHGPILPKNPSLADFLLQTALSKKYRNKIQWERLDDRLENTAHDFILKKYGQ